MFLSFAEEPGFSRLKFRMAENEEVEEVNQNKDNTKDGQKAAAALDKVTDHVEEKETEISTASK